MKIRITSRHQKLSPSLKNYIEEKLERLEKYYDRIIDCEVTMESEKTRESVDVKLKVYGTTLHVKVKDVDVTKAIDKTMDKLEVQLKKFKAKIKRRPRVRVTETLATDEV
jgi:putative sigma-54 modulation protein